MANFVNYVRTTRLIEREITRMGVALGVDWSNETQVRALAREALENGAARVEAAAAQPQNRRLMTKVSLFGLAALMLHAMADSAAKLGVESSGGPTWKSFGRALWAENELLKRKPPKKDLRKP